jgi:hypothetical protein
MIAYIVPQSVGMARIGQMGDNAQREALSQLTRDAWMPLLDTQVVVGASSVVFRSMWNARISNERGIIIVNDFDCSQCGMMNGTYCPHQELMFDALALLLEECGITSHPAMPDYDDRREAYYEAGLYPPYPMY